VFRRLIARISESHTRWIVWGMVVGVLSGLTAAVFFVALEYATHFTMHELARAAPPTPPGDAFFAPAGEPEGKPRRWLLFLLPAIGGLVSGALVYRFAPEAKAPAPTR
jgi:CIC family chloride channel protein